MDQNLIRLLLARNDVSGRGRFLGGNHNGKGGSGYHHHGDGGDSHGEHDYSESGSSSGSEKKDSGSSSMALMACCCGCMLILVIVAAVIGYVYKEQIFGPKGGKADAQENNSQGGGGATNQNGQGVPGDQSLLDGTGDGGQSSFFGSLQAGS